MLPGLLLALALPLAPAPSVFLPELDEADEAPAARREGEDAARGRGVAVFTSRAWTGRISLFGVIVGVSTCQWQRKCSPCFTDASEDKDHKNQLTFTENQAQHLGYRRMPHQDGIIRLADFALDVLEFLGEREPENGKHAIEGLVVVWDVGP